jgi:oxygen-dependent protoporphyrinogen oxidase
VQLRALGAEPVVLEAAPTTGGAIHTIRREGWIAEGGASSVADAAPEVQALLDAAGLGARMLRASSARARRYLVHRGRLAAVPTSVGELLAWPVLSAAGRMRLIKEPFVKAAPADVEETVDAFVRRRLGDEMAERVFDPLISGSTAGDPAQLLARYVLPRLVAWEQLGGSLLKGAMRAGMEARRRAGRVNSPQRGNWSCPDGLGELSALLTAQLEGQVRTGVRVASVMPVQGGFEVSDSTGQRERFAAVIFAVPAHAFGTMTIGVSDATAIDRVAAIPHASLATISLGFRRDEVAHPLDGSGVLTPGGEQREVLATLFASSLFPGRAPEGHVLMTSFVGGVRRPDLAVLAEDELVALVREEFAELLGVRGVPRFQEVTFWHDAQPQAVAGHTATLAAIDAVEASSPGLVFAGAWRDGLPLAEVMRGGIAAAHRAATRLR